VDLIAEYGKHIPGPVYIDNDADCAVFGEVMTDPELPQNALMITFGTGFGGALVIDGKIFRGCDGYGIEPGHIVLVYGGRECNCGMRGCVEAYVSVPALVEQSREKMAANPKSLMWESCIGSAGNRDPALVDGRTAFIAARRGDKAALELLEEFIALAAQAIGSLITVYRPEKVIIGGGLCNEGDFFISPLYEAAKKCYFGYGLMPMPPLVKARLGNDAGIIGAAMLASQPQPNP
jgi:glucokinase